MPSQSSSINGRLNQDISSTSNSNDLGRDQPLRAGTMDSGAAIVPSTAPGASHPHRSSVSSSPDLNHHPFRSQNEQGIGHHHKLSSNSQPGFSVQRGPPPHHSQRRTQAPSESHLHSIYVPSPTQIPGNGSPSSASHTQFYFDSPASSNGIQRMPPPEGEQRTPNLNPKAPPPIYPSITESPQHRTTPQPNIPSSVLAARVSSRSSQPAHSALPSLDAVSRPQGHSNTNQETHFLAHQQQTTHSLHRVPTFGPSQPHHPQHQPPQNSPVQQQPHFNQSGFLHFKYDLQGAPSHPDAQSRPRSQQRRTSMEQAHSSQVTPPNHLQQNQASLPQQQQQQHQQHHQHQHQQPQQPPQQQRRRRESSDPAPPPPSAHPPSQHPPPSTKHTPPVHPAVMALAANALTPVQTLFEQAWSQTVARVQNEMTKMHYGFTAALEAEQKRHEQLRKQRDAAREEVHRLQAENLALKEAGSSVEALREEEERLREEGNILAKEVEVKRLEVEGLGMETGVLRRLQYENGRLTNELVRTRVGENAGGSAMMEVVRAEFGRQVEVRMAAILKDAQEQKSLRLQAEKKLADAVAKLKTITDTALAPASCDSTSSRPNIDIDTNVDRPSSSEPTTAIGTPVTSTMNLKQEQEQEEPGLEQINSPRSHDDRTHGISVSPHLATRGSSDSPSIEPRRLPRSTPALRRLSSQLSSSDGIHLTASSQSISGTPLSASRRHPSPPSCVPTSPTSKIIHPRSHNVQDNVEPDRQEGPRKRSRLEFEEVESEAEAERRKGAVKMRIESVSEGQIERRTKEDHLEVVRVREDIPSPLLAIIRPKTADTEDDTDDQPARREKKPEVGEVDTEDGEIADDVSKLLADTPKTESTTRTPLTTTTTNVESSIRNKFGIIHLDLLYEKGDKMVCRMCTTRRNSGKRLPVVSFPLNASWTSLVGHCEREHLAACEELVNLSHCQVVELRQRMTATKSSRR